MRPVITALSSLLPIAFTLSTALVGCDPHSGTTSSLVVAPPERQAPSALKPHSMKRVVYKEKFSRPTTDWVKVDGPGLLEVIDKAFRHTTSGYSVWCQYAYSVRTFGIGRYELNVFVTSEAVNTAFVWRAPDLQTVTASGGAYLATFNNSSLAPGTDTYFTLEKLDPLGRTMLLEIPNQFLGLNKLVIEDTGDAIRVLINGVDYGTVDVTALSPPAEGYIFLIGGDRAGGDYFDDIVIRQ